MKTFFTWLFDFVAKMIAKSLSTKHYDKNVWTPQIKAKKSPFSSCFSHSSAWFLQNAGVEVSPDEITNALNTDPIYLNWAKTHYGSATVWRFRGKMQMLWELQLYYINKKLLHKGTSAIFTSNANMQSVKSYLDRGPVIISTSPKYRGKTLGHVMLIVGKTDEEFIIDDPFGDFRNEYADGNETGGDDIKVMFEEFHEIMGGLAIHYLKSVG